MGLPIILIGYGGHGFVAVDILQEAKELIGGYCDNEEKKLNPFSIPYKGTEKGFFMNTQNCKNYAAFVAIGNTWLRQKIYSFLASNEVEIINAIHPKSIISNTSIIGNGVFVAANAVINPLCTIGNGVICNTSSSIDHECNIGEFTHICPGTILCGNVTIGKRSFIGANSTIIPGVVVGDDVIIGAGSTVINNIVDAGVYAGSPARFLKVRP